MGKGEVCLLQKISKREDFFFYSAIFINYLIKPDQRKKAEIVVNYQNNFLSPRQM